jgi:hypothetical protein
MEHSNGNGNNPAISEKYRNETALTNGRWKPGQSGNPSGRPKKILSNAIEKQLSPEVIEKLALAVLSKAIKGDVRALELLFERFEGKMPDKVEMSYTKELSDEQLEARAEELRAQQQTLQ